MAIREKPCLAVAARVTIVLPEESLQVGPRPEVGHRRRRKRETLPDIAQRHVKDQVLAVVQPLRVASYLRPGRAPERHRPRRGLEQGKVNLLHAGQGNSPQRPFESRAWVGHEKATDHVRRVLAGKWCDELLQPGRLQPNPGIRNSDDLATGFRNRGIAPRGDVEPWARQRRERKHPFARCSLQPFQSSVS